VWWWCQAQAGMVAAGEGEMERLRVLRHEDEGWALIRSVRP
jgi:hypothetical protein